MNLLKSDDTDKRASAVWWMLFYLYAITYSTMSAPLPQWFRSLLMRPVAVASQSLFADERHGAVDE